MRREIPLGTAVVIIVLVVIIVVALGWFLVFRRPVGEVPPPLEFMPKKPPYAPKNAPQSQPPGL